MAASPPKVIATTPDDEDVTIRVCRVHNVNVVNWTVDVYSKFDRKFYGDVQVASPYLHHNSGEGIYAVPEVGATCILVIPSDSSPPFVLAFLMPFQSIDASSSDALQGTGSNKGKTSGATDVTFAGGRPRAAPGDIYLRTRDDNFVILHRGGVLQIGSTELAQRLYIPLHNHIIDISGNYSHQNTGGSINWGLQMGGEQPTQHQQTFRVSANDKYADVRVSTGTVYSPTAEPSGSAGETSELKSLGIGTGDVIVHEVSVVPKSFDTGTGGLDKSDSKNKSVFRFFFDRAGGTFLRCQANCLVSVKKKLKLKVTESLEIESKSAKITCTDGVDVKGGSYVKIDGTTVRLGADGATRPVAALGDAVSIMIPTAVITGTLAGSPFTGTLTLATPSNGVISSCMQKKVLVP